MQNNNKDSKNDSNPKKTEPLSTYKQKINTFYNFKIDNVRLQSIEKKSKLGARRYFITGIIFGFITQYLLGNTKIYDNAVDKATIRRLNAKKKEDEKIDKIKSKQNYINIDKIIDIPIDKQ